MARGFEPADPGDAVDGAADGEEAAARFVEVVATTAAEGTATGCSIAARRLYTLLYDSYTSTVGQYIADGGTSAGAAGAAITACCSRKPSRCPALRPTSRRRQPSEVGVQRSEGHAAAENQPPSDQQES